MWTIADLAEDIRRSLADGASDGDRLRLVRQFLMDAKGTDVTEVIVQTPAPTGQAHWNAFLAALAEYVSQPSGIKIPKWCVAPDRLILATWWFVMPFKSLHGLAMVETPAAFANRGVFIRRASLVNV